MPGETSRRGFVKQRLWHSTLRAGVWFCSFSVMAIAPTPLVHNIHAVLGIRNCLWEALLWSLCDLIPSRNVLTVGGCIPWRKLGARVKEPRPLSRTYSVWEAPTPNLLRCLWRRLLSWAQATEISRTCAKLLGENWCWDPVRPQNHRDDVTFLS